MTEDVLFRNVTPLRFALMLAGLIAPDRKTRPTGYGLPQCMVELPRAGGDAVE